MTESHIPFYWRIARSVGRRIAAMLPSGSARAMQSLWHTQMARTHRLISDEPEFALLSQWLQPGDIAIDVGANVGAYTLRMAELVGETGRILAFEPIPQTFATLVRTVRSCGLNNVTLINAACGTDTSLVGMSIPQSSTGTENIYTAHIVPTSGQFQCLCVAIDSLYFGRPVRLVKVDAEGHDPAVVFGMREWIARHRPTLIVESTTEELTDWLSSLSYTRKQLPGSPNTVFEPSAGTEPLQAQGLT